MAGKRRIEDASIPVTAMADTDRRREWREKARRYYWSSEVRRKAKIEAVEAYEAKHPDRVRETKRLTELRRSRGTTRAYEKASNDA